LHISKYYVSHIMSNKLKMGFNDYINSIRVSNACKYLRKTDKSITEISGIVGFNTMRTFNRAFLKQTGMTPSEYREKR
ncbi:MAG: helix-turn-helix transcriptional regulator, partial [Clostridia bacterium]|nr:helix-turn-helix transcriptional regulator [Clostridia bacterium]